MAANQTGNPIFFRKNWQAANRTTSTCQKFDYAFVLVMPKIWQGQLGLKAQSPVKAPTAAATTRTGMSQASRHMMVQAGQPVDRKPAARHRRRLQHGVDEVQTCSKLVCLFVTFLSAHHRKPNLASRRELCAVLFSFVFLGKIQLYSIVANKRIQVISGVSRSHTVRPAQSDEAALARL